MDLVSSKEIIDGLDEIKKLDEQLKHLGIQQLTEESLEIKQLISELSQLPTLNSLNSQITLNSEDWTRPTTPSVAPKPPTPKKSMGKLPQLTPNFIERNIQLTGKGLHNLTTNEKKRLNSILLALSIEDQNEDLLLEDVETESMISFDTNTLPKPPAPSMASFYSSEHQQTLLEQFKQVTLEGWRLEWNPFMIQDVKRWWEIERELKRFRFEEDENDYQEQDFKRPLTTQHEPKVKSLDEVLTKNYAQTCQFFTNRKQHLADLDEKIRQLQIE